MANGIVFCVLVCVSAALGSADKKAELEAKAADILKQTDVDRRKQVDVLYSLGDLYYESGDFTSAMRLYGEGLRVDSLNYGYQLKHAELLLKAGRQSEAVAALEAVYRYAEDAALIAGAGTLLSRTADVLAGPGRNDTDAAGRPILYLVPIGEKHDILLAETAAGLAKIIGLDVSVMDAADIEPGPFDRHRAESYLRRIAENIEATLEPQEYRRRLLICGVSDIQSAPYNLLKVFVWSFLKDHLRDDQFAEFADALSAMEQQGQYDANRLLDLLTKQHPLSSPAVGCLGITHFDICTEDTNFLFGLSRRGHAVMSYHRFRGEFNNQPQHRPRLVKRMVKQAVSSTFFILDIRRCNTPMCMRAYPNSLDEHDLKEDTLCRWCQDQLKEKLAAISK